MTDPDPGAALGVDAEAVVPRVRTTTMIDPTKFSRLEITNPRYARQWIPLRRCGVRVSLPPALLDDGLFPVPTLRPWALDADFKIKLSLARHLDGASRVAVLHVLDAARGATYSVPVDLRLADVEQSPERPARWVISKAEDAATRWRRNREADREFQSQAHVRLSQPVSGEVTESWSCE